MSFLLPNEASAASFAGFRATGLFDFAMAWFPEPKRRVLSSILFFARSRTLNHDHPKWHVGTVWPLKKRKKNGKPQKWTEKAGQEKPSGQGLPRALGMKTGWKMGLLYSVIISDVEAVNF